MDLNQRIPELVHLDEAREELLAKSRKALPKLIYLPLAAIIMFIVLRWPVPVVMVFSFLSIMVSAIAYQVQYRTPFKVLSGKVRSAMVAYFMQTFHPAIEFNYTYEGEEGEQLISQSGLISADKTYEEDVLTGKKGDTDFYISEVHLKNESDKSSTTVFKGLLFKLKIKGKSFPKTKIQSRGGLFRGLFGSFKAFEGERFWYKTDDESRFFDEMSTLFPFIEYLKNKQGDIRISAEGESMTILVKSDMKFLDDPKPNMDRSFVDELYFKNMAKHLNSLLFIVESFADNLNTNEIEDRLELKAIDLLERERLKENRR